MIEKTKEMKLFVRVLACVVGCVVLAFCAFAAFAAVTTIFGRPQANRANNTTVAASGDTVMLSLDSTSVTVLNAYHSNHYSLTVYESDTDLIDNVKSSDDSSEASEVIVAGDTPISGVQYATYLQYNAGEDAQWPMIFYTAASNSTETTLTPETNYQYGTRVITRVALADAEDSGGYTYTVTYQNPDTIALSGEIGDVITLATMTQGRTLTTVAVENTMDEAVTTTIESSVTASFQYTVAGQTSVATAYPATGLDSITTVDVGDSIVLVTEDASTMIFYTTDNSVPEIEWNTDIGNWWAANNATQYYSGAITVPGPIFAISSTPTTFTVTAVVVTSGNTGNVQSEITSFTYIVNALPSAQAPSISPTTSTDLVTALANGSEIYLSCNTSGGEIFYTTNGVYPDVEAWISAYVNAYYDESVTTEEEAYAYASAQTGVFIYDTANPIVMQARSDDTFTVKALTVDLSSSPSYSISDLATYTFTLAQASTPTSTIATSADEITVVSPGTQIKLMTTTSNTTIYFTTDNTVPVPEQAVVYAPDTTQTGTLIYDSSIGITMPSDISALFTIRAIAQSDVVVDTQGNLQYANSEEAIFYYQLPSDVAVVTASPIGATSTSKDLVSVVENTLVSLSCGTEDAVIYYEIYYSTEDLQAAMADHSLTASNSELYNADVQITIRKECWVRAVATKDGMYSSESIFGYTTSDKLTAPTASLPSGSVVQNGSTIVLSGSGDVMYTTDGTDPSAADSTAVYGNSIVFNGEEGASVIIRAYTVSDGYTPSETATFTYTISAADSYLQASPASGTTVQEGDVITLVTSLTGAEIFYTTDGTTPTVINALSLYESSDNGYTSYEWSASTGTTAASSVTVSGEPGDVFTIKAVSLANGATGNTTAVFSYTIAEQTLAPTASIPSGAITLEGATVTLTASEGSIYYTTDGSDPTNSSTLYTGPIEITTSMTLKIRAYNDGKKASEIVTYVYTRAGQVATPVASVASGTIEIGTVVSLSTTTENATIYYSTDGTDPTESNISSLMFYDQSFAVTRSVTVKMMAVATGLDASEVVTITYTVVDAPVETDSPTVETNNVTSTDRLVSRRDYSTQEDGPSYSDVVLQDSETLVIVSADDDVISSSAVLGVTVVQATSDETASATASGYEIVSMYEVTLTENGEAIVPSGTFEIGVPITSDSYNASVSVAQFTSTNADIQTLETRRSGGYGYVQVDEVARYAVVMPLTSASVSANVVGTVAQAAATHLPLVAFVSTVILLSAGCVLVILRRRAAQQVQVSAVQTETELLDTDDPYEKLDSFFHV